MAEICELHARLVANLRLGMSVFLNGDRARRAEAARGKGAVPRPRARLRRPHLDAPGRQHRRRASRPVSLHIDLISDLKRINSHICSIAYPILESAGVLAKTRLKSASPEGEPAEGGDRGGPRWSKRKPTRRPGVPADADDSRCAVTLAVLGAGLPARAAGTRCSSSRRRRAAARHRADRRRRRRSSRSRCCRSSALPDRAAWPFMRRLGGHPLRLLRDARAARTGSGDLSFAYPLMRGIAPLIVTVLGIVFLGELPDGDHRSPASR